MKLSTRAMSNADVRDGGFAAFQEKVFADRHLQDRLRAVTDRDAFVALVVQAGEENGFHFTATDVASAIMRGHMASLTSWSPII
jgi:Nif11 domain